MAKIADQMDTLHDAADPGLQLARTFQSSPCAWLTVRMPQSIARYLLSRPAALIAKYGCDLAIFAHDVKTAARKEIEGRYVKPGYSPASVSAHGDFRGRRDLVSFSFYMTGEQWKRVKEIAEQIHVKPSTLIRAGLWSEYRTLRDADEKEQEERRVQFQIANPTTHSGGRPAGANPLSQIIDDEASAVIQGVECRQIIFKMPCRLMEDLREYWKGQGVPGVRENQRNSPALHSILSEGRSRPPCSATSREALLQMVMKEMMSGSPEGVSLFIPETIWQEIVARSEHFGITPAEDCAISIAHHVALYRRKGARTERANPLKAFERKLRTEARAAKAEALRSEG